MKAFSVYMPKHDALRDLHVDNSSLSHALTAAFVRAADALHNVTSVHFEGITCSLRGTGAMSGQAGQPDVVQR